MSTAGFDAVWMTGSGQFTNSDFALRARISRLSRQQQLAIKISSSGESEAKPEAGEALNEVPQMGMSVSDCGLGEGLV